VMVHPVWLRVESMLSSIVNGPSERFNMFLGIISKVT